MAPSTTRNRTSPGADLHEDEVELGKVVGVFGVRGELRVFLHNPESSILLGGPSSVMLILPDGARRTARLTCRKGAGKRILGRLDGLEDRDEAAAMKGTRIVVPRASLPAPDEGEFYVADLQGLAVVVAERRVGHVVDVHHTAAGDLLELDIGGETEFLAMASDGLLDIDIDAGQLVVAAGAIPGEGG